MYSCYIVILVNVNGCDLALYHVEGQGHPCLRHLCSDTCGGKKPLFVIVDVLCLYNIFRKFMNIGEIHIFSNVLYRKFESTLSRPFPWSICSKYRWLFFCFVYVIISLNRNKLLNIVLFGTEQFCSSNIIWGRICLNLFAIFVSIL